MNAHESRLLTILVIKHMIEGLLKKGQPVEVTLEQMDEQVNGLIKQLPKERQSKIKIEVERINLETDAMIEEELG